MRSISEVFYDFTAKEAEATRLKVLAKDAEKEAEKLRAVILDESRLHDILTTTGVVHGRRIYKKMAINHDESVARKSTCYYLTSSEYNPPINSFQLDDAIDYEEPIVEEKRGWLR